jgi:hypothetical protein
MTTNIYSITDTWNEGSTVFTAIKMTITDTAYAAGSYMMDISSAVAGGYFRADVDGNIFFSGYMDVAPMTAPTWSEGRVYYDSTEKALSYYNEESDVTINLGQESVLRVINTTGVQVDNGKMVYISGASGGLPEVDLAQATTGQSQVVGMATHDIGDGTIGYVTTFGIVRGIDTSGYSPGDTLWLSDAVAGDITNVQPIYPLRVVQVGTCITSDAVTGKIFIDIDQNSGVLALVKSYTFASRSATSGEYYQAGFYEAATADANLTNASTTVVYGTANSPHPAHAFIVSAGDGASDGSDLVLTVSGTSITDAGVRTPGDSQVIVADALVSGCPVDTYLETSKKWLGAITFTLSSSGGAAFAFSFNYGLAKYEDFNNVDSTLRGLECVGLADANDPGFNIQLYVHNDIGWTYAATGFVSGNTPILDMNVIHGTENDVKSGEHFAFKRTGLSNSVASSSSEGLIIKVTTTVNNSISYMDSHLTVTIP